MAKNRQWHLASRPSGELSASNFELRESPVPEPGNNQFLIRTIYLSLDPTHRLWAREKASYMPSVKLGEVMRGFTMGVVEKSNHPGYPVGAIVTGVFGWEDYSLSDGSGIVARDSQSAVVNVHAEYPAGPELCGGDRENSRTAAVIEHGFTPLQTGTEPFQAKPSSGV